MNKNNTAKHVLKTAPLFNNTLRKTDFKLIISTSGVNLRPILFKTQINKFHNTPIRKADPGLVLATSTVAAGSMLGTQLIVMSGLLVTLLSYYLTPGRGAPVGGEEEYDPNILEPIGIPVGIFDDGLNIILIIIAYLTTVGQFGEIAEVTLNNLPVEQLRTILINMEGIINMHELAFRFTNHFTNIWDPSDVHFDDINMFHETWRAAGNSLMEIYRSIENVLGISPATSRLPIAWYEGW